jgi:hypothetical protein
MNDNHIIRVIVQGYDRLSNVMRDAANRSAPALQNLNDRVHRLRNETNQTNDSLGNLSKTINNQGDVFDNSRKKIERLGDSYDRLKKKMRERFAPSLDFSESPEDMFARLRKEGRPPRTGPGFTTFQKKDDFVAEENERRKTKQALLEQEHLYLRIKNVKEKIFEGKFPFDDIVRGLNAGRKAVLETEQDSAESIRIRREAELALLRDSRAQARLELKKRQDDEKEAAIDSHKDRLAELRKEISDEKVANRIIQDDYADRLDQIDRQRKKAVTKKDADLEASLVAEREELRRESAAESEASAERVRIRREALSKIERDAGASADRTASRQLQKFDEETKSELRKVRERAIAETANIPDLIRKRDAARAESFKTRTLPDGTIQQTRLLERQAAKLSAGFSDFFRGVRGGKDDLADFKNEAGKAQTTLAQMGSEVGKATRSLGNFINLRWLLVLGFMGSLLTIAVELGAALVAVASSAIVAAAALGGALVTGVGAAIPVVGLLAAAFHELTNAMKVVQLRQAARDSSAVDAVAQEKARRSAVQALADAHYGLKQAILGVSDAEQGLKDAHQAVIDSEKAQQNAIRDLAEARRNQRKAIVDAALEERDARLGVREAELGVLDAKKKLADFEDSRRRQGADLEEAQSALQEAQDRLALARKQGDVVEIATASAAVAAARSNVNSVQDQISATANQQKELEVGVERAKLNVDQAEVRRKRAIADNKRLRSQGVEGSPEVKAAVDRVAQSNRDHAAAIRGVVSAQRSLNDSNHSVMLAHRSVRDAAIAVTAATDKMSAAQRNAQREFNKLSPAEQGFVKSMEKLQKDMKTFLRPITDIIISAFSRGLNRADQLVRDPKIRASLTVLAGEIAKVGDKFTKWAISPEGRRAILFFIHEASRELPIIADAAGRFLRVLIRIGIAAAPIFDGIVGGIDKIAKKWDDWTSKAKKFSPQDAFHHRETNKATGNLEKFFNGANKHLSAWGRLTKAIGSFLVALIKAASPVGLKMVNGMAEAFNKLADRINKNPKAVRDFFENVRKGLAELLPVLGKFALDLVKAFSSKNFIEFTKFVVEIMIPGLIQLINYLGAVAGAISKFFEIPVVGPFAKFVLQLSFGYLALRKLLPIFKVFDAVFLKLGAAMKGVILIVPKFIASMLGIDAVATKAFFSNPWVIAIGAIILAIILLDRKFHFLKPTIEAIGRAFRSVFDWIKDHWKLVLALLLGPIGLAVDAIATHWGTIKRAFSSAFRFISDILHKLDRLIYHSFISPFDDIAKWFRTIASWLSAHIFGRYHSAVESEMKKIATSIFEGFIDGFKQISKWFENIAGWLKNNVIGPILRFFGIHSPSTLMFNIGMDVVHGFVNAFKKLPSLLLGVLKGLPGKILGLFTGLGKMVYNHVKGGIESAARGIGTAAKKTGGFLSHVGNVVGGAVVGAVKEAGGAVKGAGQAVLEQEAWSNREQVNQEIIYRHIPSVWYKRGYASAMGAVAADKGFKATKFIQYSTDGQDKLTVVLEDSDQRRITITKNGKATPKAHFASGGEVGGREGRAVPIVAHAGEWVLNKMQQLKLAARLGASTDAISLMLFGGKGRSPKSSSATGRTTRVAGPSTQFPNGVQLLPHKDEYGYEVWFLKLADGEFAQVSAKAAKKIQASGGTWFPKYINRAHGGPFMKSFLDVHGPVAYANGGVVSFGSTAARGFASGGVVGQGGSVITGPSKGTVEVNQEFNVRTEGDSDWNHIMRLGAQKSQEAWS